ncbi:MAG: phosphoadenylyl-sulfate reductase [Bacteroidia bacterium]
MKSEGKSMFLSSSFQTHSIPLLHLISTIDNSIPVYFLNTGFHFPETLAFRNQLTDRFDLNLINLQPDIEKIHQKDSKGRFFYSSDTDYCCHLNKILPMEVVMHKHDVWIAGVRAEQNQNRQGMKRFQEGRHNTMRYHPILDWSSKDIYDYRVKFDLPAHPLEEQGYLSVGCEPCTAKFLDEGRAGRWDGTKKDECGLHIELLEK